MRGRERAAACGALVAMVAAGACAPKVQPDAYGNVEATEVVVAAEASGRLVSYAVADGQALAEGAVVGSIDTAQLTLERDQFVAQRAATASRLDEIERQTDALSAQRSAAMSLRDAAIAERAALVTEQEIAKRAYDRTTRLFAQQAATAQQLDQAEREYRVLGDRITAKDEQITAEERQVAAQAQQIQAARAQRATAAHQVAAADAQVGQLGERLRKTGVTSPLAGTVLVTYVRGGEFVQTGQPLFKIANLDSVNVRAYVTEPQLSGIRLGQGARVSVDAGGARQVLAGELQWIASQAEFTPTPIQTREERADLVYAVKIRVPNGNGRLKIGMPVDVTFDKPSATP